ncbi:bifunctional phosphoribosylaminoimidazole carboxylase/phosphoribosylaminoimidazole succinocarboxamide synthetase [Halyomorpha halys]|uniref:bifunctional phosphoribosylaminoimidazole carboxylase/phosphoribosylaminoimidazole succinocarboxamide synthetase n=1 Tax=Halyomorpha halys TaxID=286706 RepID=UPI0006D4D47E|nr:multifunctional protein ADE2 [Halyomorpha halys]
MPEEVAGYKLGSLVIEGKTKKVFNIDNSEEVVIISKDRITAGDGIKSHELKGKAEISTKTNAKVFEYLNSLGLKTSFIKTLTDTAFLAKKCEMIPIEWVTRRLATGSFLKRNAGVKEGYRFSPPLEETFFKDDANHDPQWSDQQIISANFNFNGVAITRHEVDIMKRTAITVFEVLERAWASRSCALIDMKIEFGIDSKGEILVSDIIDSDSWRLWPSGDKRLMKDKQVYRELSEVTQHDLEKIKSNFQWISDQLDYFKSTTQSLAVIVMGSPSDEEHCMKIKNNCEALGLPCELRVSSAHKETEETLKLVAEYEGLGRDIVFIAVAGRSNGLGPVISGNTSFPVINCPPSSQSAVQDIWSSLGVPSGLGCTTVLYPETAALAATQIHALKEHMLWSRLRVRALNNYLSLKKADGILRKR